MQFSLACVSVRVLMDVQRPSIPGSGLRWFLLLDVDVRCCTVAVVVVVVPDSDSSAPPCLCLAAHVGSHQKNSFFFLSFWGKTCKALSSALPGLPRPRNHSLFFFKLLNHSLLFFVFENYSFFGSLQERKRKEREKQDILIRIRTTLPTLCSNHRTTGSIYLVSISIYI